MYGVAAVSTISMFCGTAPANEADGDDDNRYERAIRTYTYRQTRETYTFDVRQANRKRDRQIVRGSDLVGLRAARNSGTVTESIPYAFGPPHGDPGSSAAVTHRLAAKSQVLPIDDHHFPAMQPCEGSDFFGHQPRQGSSSARVASLNSTLHHRGLHTAVCHHHSEHHVRVVVSNKTIEISQCQSDCVLAGAKDTSVGHNRSAHRHRQRSCYGFLRKKCRCFLSSSITD